VNVEGLSATITTEWIWTSGTAIPIVVSLCWGLHWHRLAWRRAIWEQCGRDIRRVALKLEGRVMATGRGWGVKTSDGSVQVRWSAGWTRETTQIVLRQSGDCPTRSVDGLAPSHWVLEQVRYLRDLVKN